MQLRGKTIFIAGASAGIGRCVAMRLAEADANLVITARRRLELEQVAAAVRPLGSRCVVVVADALDDHAADQAVKRAIGAFGKIDAALLNIGEGPAYNMATASASAVKSCMRINYDATVNYLIPLIEHMKHSGGGLIAHTNSLAGFLGVPMQGPYSAAKSACRLLLDTCRTELKQHNVRFTSIYPGFIATERTADDGIPAPFEISAERCARHIVDAMERETADAAFPWQTAWMTRTLQRLPKTWAAHLMMKFTPADY